MTYLYFAYGSNMEPATFRGRRGIEPLRAVAARARGWRIVFDKPPLLPVGEGFANLIADSEATVLGVLYEITQPDLEHLDLTEGVLIGNYQRITIPVETLEHVPPGALATPPPPDRAYAGDALVPGKTVAFTLTSPERDPSLRPSTRYMRCLIAGAEAHGLPRDYVDFLRSIATGEETEAARRLRPLVDQVLGARNREPTSRDS